MKKLVISIFLCMGFMACVLLFSACRKEKTISSEETVVSTNLPDTNEGIGFRGSGFDYSQCPSLKSAVYKSGDMLVFQDRAHFDKCAICLENDYDVYNDAYDA